MQFDRHQLAAISGLARTGSFEKAAALLQITPSAVSQRVKAIEDLIGAAVVVRGRPCVLTAVGQRLLRHHDEIQLLESQIGRDLISTDEVPVLRIGLSAGAPPSLFMPVFASQTGLIFDFAVGSENQCAAWLDQSEITAAIATIPQRNSGYDAKCLGVLRHLPVASPAFVALHLPSGLSSASLRRVPALRSGPEDDLPEKWMARRFDSRFGDFLSAHRIPESQGLVAAATAGMGWGLVPEPMASSDLAKGQLVLLDPLSLDRAIYWHCRKPMQGALRPLEERLMQVASSILHAVPA